MWAPESGGEYVHVSGLAVIKNFSITYNQRVVTNARHGDQQTIRRIGVKFARQFVAVNRYIGVTDSSPFSAAQDSCGTLTMILLTFNVCFSFYIFRPIRTHALALVSSNSCGVARPLKRA